MNKLLVTVFAALLAMPAAALAQSSDLGSARDAVSQMEQASMQVTNLVNNAKANNDAIKFSCLSDKATQIKSYVKGAQSSLGRANGLAGAAQEDMVRGIMADAATVQLLRTAATDCVGVAEAEEAEQDDSEKVAAKGAQKFDALDPRESATSRGTAPSAMPPSIRSLAPASPAASPFR